MKQLDRFERQATRVSGYASTFHGTSIVLHYEKVLTLLRRQHNAYVRLVKAQRQYGAWINVEELLVELARRVK